MAIVPQQYSIEGSISMPDPRGTYTIGPPKRPNITHDNGFLDRFERRDPTAGDYARLALWRTVLEAAEAGQSVPMLPHNDIPDALAAYRHFLEGNGRTREINYERFLSGDPVGPRYLRNLIREAKLAAHHLYSSRPPGALPVFQFTGTHLPAGSSGNRAFPYPETENWQKAIGAHFFWISGDVTVSHTPPGQPEFDMTFTVRIEDRYNFNPGQQDIGTGLPDEMNGQLALAGLGDQYLNIAEIMRQVEWTGSPVGMAGTEVDGAPRFRQREPGDNRRIRNRI